MPPAIVRKVIRDMIAAEIGSVRPTCAIGSHTTKRPGRASTCIAIWLHNVPVGR